MSTVDRSNQWKLDPADLAAELGSWSAGPGPLYRQLAAAVAQLLDDGAIASGTVLPPERRLAGRLAVSRGTVVNAYRLLDQQGWLRRVQGRGTIVTGPARSPGGADRPLETGDPGRTNPSLRTIDLLAAIPDALPEVLDICQRTNLLRDPDIVDNAEPAGIYPLRSCVAEMYDDLGLSTSPEQIVVTSGAQQALALTVNAITRPGDVALVEAFTWPGLLDVVQGAGARVHAAPMDDDGIVVDQLSAMVERLRPRLIAINPHNHNPTGTCLPPTRREAVAEICAEFGVTIIEDRVAALMGFNGEVPPPLAAHRPDGSHVTIGSLNKVTWPGLRIGWIRTDTPTVATLRAAKALNDLYSSIPSQLMALDTFGSLGELQQVRRDKMFEQATMLMSELRTRLPEWRFRSPQGGVVLWVELPGGRATAFSQTARSFGVSVPTSAEFAAGADGDDHLRLPFTLPPRVLQEAVQRLATAWSRFSNDRVPAGARAAPSII